LRNNILETRAEFSLAEGKTRCEDGDGRILLGDNTAGGELGFRGLSVALVSSF